MENPSGYTIFQLRIIPLIVYNSIYKNNIWYS